MTSAESLGVARNYCRMLMTNNPGIQFGYQVYDGRPAVSMFCKSIDRHQQLYVLLDGHWQGCPELSIDDKIYPDPSSWIVD